jgi:anti-anti-sigma regulatory factor
MEAVKASWRDRQICRAKYGRSLSPPHGKRERLRRRSWSLVLHRFGATLVFFNAPYFKKRVREVAATHPGIKWFIVDGSTINSIDSTGAAMLEALSEDLHAPGYPARLCQPPNRGLRLLERSGVQAVLGDGALFTTLKSAVDACASGGFAETSETGTGPSQAPAPGGFQFPQPVSPSHWRPMHRSLCKGNPLPKCSATNYLHVEEIPIQ